MEFKIEKREDKPLVEREEIVIKVIGTNATPSNAQMQEAIAKLVDKPNELVVVKKILQQFGMRQAIVYAYIYKNEEAMKRYEPKKKEKKEKKTEIK